MVITSNDLIHVDYLIHQQVKKLAQTYGATLDTDPKSPAHSDNSSKHLCDNTLDPVDFLGILLQYPYQVYILYVEDLL